jgi:mRNA interferase MazF
MVSLSMIKYKIVLVPFPFDDFSDTKLRPALCLTDYIGNFNQNVIAFNPAEFLKIYSPVSS